MNLRWTALAGEQRAGKTVDLHRTQAMEMIIQGIAVALDPIDNIERQIIAEKIEARKASQLITVMHITPEDLDESKSGIE
jgi:ABC-type dipeptide/oligopeptide/nickel transport system ATPase component